MNKHSERPFSKTPFLLRNAACFATDIPQQPQVALSQVPETADATVLSNCNKIQGREGLEIPFHVRQYHEIGVRSQHFLLLRTPIEDILYP
jgi:hypothetical protein